MEVRPANLPWPVTRATFPVPNWKLPELVIEKALLVVPMEKRPVAVEVPTPTLPAWVMLKMLVVVATENKDEAVEVPIPTLPVEEATYKVGVVLVPTYMPPQTSRVSLGVVVAMPKLVKVEEA